MKQVSFLILRQIEKYPDPCQSADTIIYDYQENQDITNKGKMPAVYSNASKIAPVHNGSFWFMIAAPFHKFKVIEHKQAYDFQSLVGNTGGYLGLFLGK